MPALRELLDRFRVAGPPGPAAPAAVPADRRSRLLDEVAPIFAALAPTVRRAEGIVAAASAEADRVREDAERVALAIVKEAEDGCEVVRATAFAEATGTARERAETSLARARQSARRIVEEAAGRRSALVERAVEHTRRTAVP